MYRQKQTIYHEDSSVIKTPAVKTSKTFRPVNLFAQHFSVVFSFTMFSNCWGNSRGHDQWYNPDVCHAFNLISRRGYDQWYNPDVCHAFNLISRRGYDQWYNPDVCHAFNQFHRDGRIIGTLNSPITSIQWSIRMILYSSYCKAY